MRHLTPQQSRLMRRRARMLAAVLAVVCFGGLLARLCFLQLLQRTKHVIIKNLYWSFYGLPTAAAPTAPLRRYTEVSDL